MSDLPDVLTLADVLRELRISATTWKRRKRAGRPILRPIHGLPDRYARSELLRVINTPQAIALARHVPTVRPCSRRVQ